MLLPVTQPPRMPRQQQSLLKDCGFVTNCFAGEFLWSFNFLIELVPTWAIFTSFIKRVNKSRSLIKKAYPYIFEGILTL